MPFTEYAGRVNQRIALAVATLAVCLLAAALLWPAQPEPVAAPPRVEPPPAWHFADIPRIDVHVHIPPERYRWAAETFARFGVRVALNASGGHPGGYGLEETIAASSTVNGAIRSYCSIDFTEVESEDFAAYATSTLDECARLGAVGLKISKALGLGYMLSDGSLLRVDDPRLDVVFARAGELGLPVLIHSGDPQAFFTPSGPENERNAELSAHPSWSFYGPIPEGPPGAVWPSWQEVFDQFETRVARHPGTRILGAHFGNAPEEPETVARMLERYPNFYVETAARVPEIGRRDPSGRRAERMREIFERFPDRILFGTDFQVGRRGTIALGSSGEEPDTEARIPFFFEQQFRYFETRDTDFASPTPIQGEWNIDGIGLSRELLERFYYRNAMALFGLPDPTAPPPPR